MRELTEREKFIIDCVIMITSSKAKSFPRIIRQAILRYIRDTKYPSISNDEWHEIALNIDKHKDSTMDALRSGFSDALLNPTKIIQNVNMLTLDKTIRENMNNIDLSNISTPDLSEKDLALLLAAKQMKRDFDEKR